MMDTFPTSCLDSHACFRILLQAMSRPGTLYRQPEPCPQDARDGVLRFLATIIDAQVGCCLIDPDPQFARHLKELARSEGVAAEQADFLIALQGDSRGHLANAKRGRSDFPDQGATVVYLVERLESGCHNGGIVLSGPGIETTQIIDIIGLGSMELNCLREVNSEFPLGVDAIFFDRRGGLMCIPRSTTIGEN